MSANQEALDAILADHDAFLLGAVDLAAHAITSGLVRQQGRSPGPPVATGALRGSLRLTLDTPSSEPFVYEAVYHPILGAVEVDAVLSKLNLGQQLWWIYLADYAAVLQEGRKPGTDGVIRGSLQTPQGWVHLALLEAEVRFRSATSEQLIARGRKLV